MSFPSTKTELNLSQIAREMFGVALAGVNPQLAVQRAVRLENEQLFVQNSSFDLRQISNIYSIALGKAAARMASGLTNVLGERLTGGVVSAPADKIILSDIWQRFTGGHPIPNEASLAAARAAVSLLAKADREDALIIFLISGGGSAMMELPSDERLTLDDLQITNRVLVNCGATIAEINQVRRKLSAIKGGGLSRAANRAKKITLVISDTNEGDLASVASGPTIAPAKNFSTADFVQIIEKYQLFKLLPAKVSEVLEESLRKDETKTESIKNHESVILLSNENAIRAAEEVAAKNNFAIEIARDLIETPIQLGCETLAKRLIDLRQRVSPETPVALISGGEFVCPVRGQGIGGRNSEATLRSILEIEKRAPNNFRFAVLHAGTDGIDGNSPAAGAVADETTLTRARAANLNAHKYLASSDAYNFFAQLNDALLCGATGTNVRDIRIFLA